MKTFLLAVAGVVAGVLLLVAIGWLWLRRKLKGLGKALGALAAGLSGVPPFRITLLPMPDDGFEDAASVDAATASFERAGYQRLDDFEIPEMEDVHLRGLWHPQQRSYAVVYEHPRAGVFADAVALFTDRTLLTVSSGPETGLDRPERARVVRVALGGPDEVERLHARLVQESAGRTSIDTRPEQFTIAFEGAYRMEQDWRIARGGVSADEVRRAAQVGGQDPPDARAIELVRTTWKAAISSFVEEEVRKAWLASQPMDAAAWEARRERIRIVHDHVDVDDLCDELAWAMIAGSSDPDDDEAGERVHAQAKQTLAGLFEGGPRAGFERAQQLLPEKRRCEPLGEVARPWPATVYLEPEAIDEG